MIYKLSIKYSNSNVVRHYYFDSKFGVARFVFFAINKKQIEFIKVSEVL